MDDLASRKRELYRAYDEAALRILMDRYAEEEGAKLLKELKELPEAEKTAPAAEARAVEETLARCAGKKRAAIRRSAVVRTCGKVAAVALVLGILLGYAASTVSANQEKQAQAGSAYVENTEAEERGAESGAEIYGEERTDAEERPAG